MTYGPLHAAVLDLDGTLVDTLGDFHAALNLMLAELRLPAVAVDMVSRFVGKGSEHLILSTLAHVGMPDPRARYDAAWTSYQRHYDHINGQYSSVYPGVEAGLAALRGAGLRLACLTNKPVGFARDLLVAKGLGHHFAQVFGGDSFERRKPDPLPLLKTCEALGSAPARTVMIGDSLNDAQAGRAAGCAVWLVTYGYNHGQPIAAAPHDRLLDSLAELA